ncbi:MAG TPA: GntR family transcriptional regulator [Chloroflexota bacterium]|nr:GntR family transcriptional regulator [Chloroflexota bacterium]
MAKIDVSLLSDRVYHALREDIFAQTLRPATRLDVHHLASIYGTSAAPVRQALARLHDEGMVEILPRRGTFVTSMRPGDVAEVFQVRRIIELGVADLTAGRLPSDVVERLGRVVALTEALAIGESFRDYASYIQYDAEFHRIPILAIGNGRLLRIFDSLHAHICIARGLYPASNQRATQTLAEHRAIFDAYRAGDATAVKAAILVHLCNGEADLARRLTDEITSGTWRHDGIEPTSRVANDGFGADFQIEE